MPRPRPAIRRPRPSRLPPPRPRKRLPRPPATRPPRSRPGRPPPRPPRPPSTRPRPPQPPRRKPPARRPPPPARPPPRPRRPPKPPPRPPPRPSPRPKRPPRRPGRPPAAAAAAIAAEAAGEEADFSEPWPLDQVDLDAELVMTVVQADPRRPGSASRWERQRQRHLERRRLQRAPGPRSARPTAIARRDRHAGVDRCHEHPAGRSLPAEFHNGSIVTAHDLVFSYNRMGGIAEYHQGGATTDHPGGWAPAMRRARGRRLGPQRGGGRSHLGDRDRGARRRFPHGPDGLVPAR